MIVVDASVAVKWFLPETGANDAQQLLASGEALVAPSLIRVEVAAAIARKARLKEITRQDAEAAADLWLEAIVDGVIRLVPDETDVPGAVKLALALAHPLQDCVYLALAERLGAPMVTADQKFAARVSASHPAVCLLGSAIPGP